MELPHIGKYCSNQGCNQLDFLPVTCNLCNETFCNNHYKYEDHQCPERHKLDVRVPICPLCEQPVPSKKGIAPDIAVNQHIENNCVQKNKKTKNRCNAPGCRVKELIAIQCDACQLNFCLKHRHTVDHECKGPAVSKRERTLNGSIFRNWLNGSSSSSSNSPKSSNISSPKSSPSSGVVQVTPSSFQSIQAGMSDEEALCQAILSSQAEGNTKPSSVEPTSEEEELQKAIRASLNEQQNTNNRLGQRTKSYSDCSIS